MGLQEPSRHAVSKPSGQDTPCELPGPSRWLMTQCSGQSAFRNLRDCSLGLPSLSRNMGIHDRCCRCALKESCLCRQPIPRPKWRSLKSSVASETKAPGKCASGQKAGHSTDGASSTKGHSCSVPRPTGRESTELRAHTTPPVAASSLRTPPTLYNMWVGLICFLEGLVCFKGIVLSGKLRHTTEMYAFVNKSKIEKDIFMLKVKSICNQNVA